MYEKNLNKLRALYPLLVRNFETEYFEDLEFCETRQGEKNLKYYHEGRPRFIHSNYSIEKETTKWINSIDMHGRKVLVIYGLGLGYSFKELKSWLDNSAENHLVYLEDDPRILKSFLCLAHAEEIFTHPKVLIRILPKDTQEREVLFNELSLYYNTLPIVFSSLPHYESVKSKDFCSIRIKMRETAIMIQQVQGEYLSFGVNYLINFFSIALSLNKSFIGETLQNSFQNVPAIICGAGPSLKKNAHFLKTLQDKALIFAPGSSITALNHLGIEPHIGGSCDASPIQYERLSEHSCFELPMIFKSRMNHKAFHVMHGPRIYSYGNTQYPILDRFEEKLGLKKHALDNGLSMQQHLTNWACFMGCNPIIFVGLDLALTGNQSYAQGVQSNEKVDVFSQKDNPLLLDICLEKNDIYGNKVHTYSKWIFEAEHSALFPNRYPKNTFINSTEGGMGIKNIPNIPLSSVASEYLNKTYDLRSLIHTKLQCRQSKKVSLPDVMNEIHDVKNNCHIALNKCIHMKKYIEKAILNITNKHRSSFQKSLEEFIDLKGELEDLPIYKHFIKPISLIRRMTFGRELKEVKSDKTIQSDNERFIQICNIYLKEVEHHIKACETQLEAIEYSMRNYCRDGYGSLTAYFKGIGDKQTRS